MKILLLVVLAVAVFLFFSSVVQAAESSSIIFIQIEDNMVGAFKSYIIGIPAIDTKNTFSSALKMIFVDRPERIWKISNMNLFVDVVTIKKGFLGKPTINYIYSATFIMTKEKEGKKEPFFGRVRSDREYPTGSLEWKTLMGSAIESAVAQAMEWIKEEAAK